MAKCLMCGKFVFTWFHAVEACPVCGTPLRDQARTGAPLMTPPLAEALVDALVRVARLEALDVDSVARALGGRPGRAHIVPGNGIWKKCVLKLPQGLFAQAEVSWHPEHPETHCHVNCLRPRAAVPRTAVYELLALAARPRSIHLSWFKDEPHKACVVLLAPRDGLRLVWTADEPRRRWLLSVLSVPRAAGSIARGGADARRARWSRSGGGRAAHSRGRTLHRYGYDVPSRRAPRALAPPGRYNGRHVHERGGPDLGRGEQRGRIAVACTRA
jgi:hypothetical protein